MPDAIDMLRQQLGQAQPQANVDVTDVSQLPEMAEEAPRIGKLTKPGMDWIPAATASLKMMMSDDPERLAKSLEGTPGITIGHGKDRLPYAQIGDQKYQFNKKGLSEQDVANFMTSLVGQMGAGKLLKALPFLRGAGALVTAGRETLAGLFSGGAKEAGSQQVAGEELDPLKIGGEAALNAAGNLVGSVLGTSIGRLFKSGAQFLNASGTLTTTARRALQEAKIDPDSLDPQTLRQANTIIRQQLGHSPPPVGAAPTIQTGARPTPAEMVEGVARSDIQDTGIGATVGQRSGNLAQQSVESKLAEGVRGTPAQDVMAGARRGQQRQFENSVENTAMAESPGLPRLTEAEAGGTVRSELQGHKQVADDAVDHLYEDAAQTATASGITVPSSWRLHGPQFSLRSLGMADVNEGTAPKTAAVIDFLQQQFEGATERARAAAKAAGVRSRAVLRGITGEFDPNELEGLRKKITKSSLNTSDPTDKAAMIALRGKFDDFLDNEVGAHDPRVVEKYQNAREYFGETQKAFTQQTPADVGGKLIDKTVKGENVDQKIVDDIFGGGNKISPNGVQHYNRIVGITGPDGEGAKGLRQAMVRRIVMGGPDAQAQGTFSPQKALTSVNSALEGRGAQFVQDTLGPTTLRDLQVLQRHLGRLVRNSDVGNPPRSGFLNEAAMRAIGRLGIAGMVGGGSGAAATIMGGPIVGPLVGAAAGAVTKKAGDAIAASAGRRAAEKAIAMAPMLGPVGRGIGRTRAVTGPIGRAAEGLLPVVGGPAGKSIFDIYGPDLDLSK